MMLSSTGISEVPSLEEHNGEVGTTLLWLTSFAKEFDPAELQHNNQKGEIDSELRVIFHMRWLNFEMHS